MRTNVNGQHFGNVFFIMKQTIQSTLSSIASYARYQSNFVEGVLLSIPIEYRTIKLCTAVPSLMGPRELVHQWANFWAFEQGLP